MLLNKLNKLQIIIGLTLISQVLFAFIVSPLFQVREAFPYFRWDLFHRIERVRSIPLIYVYQVDQKKFEPPVTIYEFLKKERAPIEFVEVHDSLRELWPMSPVERKEAIVRLASQLFSDRSKVDYEVKMMEVDLFEFFQTGKTKQTTMDLGRFIYESH